uniref:Rho GTPase activating protein 22 n=1 Tax=Electrophorus electricus TaxID=8005 RepID=A0A4W4DW23_ELEEL
NILCSCGLACGEKDRSALSHEAFLLMANSQNDMEDWVKAIRRVIWAPFGGGIFGQHLEDTVLYERKFGPRLAPLLVEQCVDFIREQGLKEEGLFRMPGQANLVKELQDAFDCGDKPLFDKFLDEVQSHSNENKMSVQNLATVFGPNILRPKIEDPVTMMEGTSQVQHLMTLLISEHERLYGGVESCVSGEEGEASPRGQRSTVGWLSEESNQRCPSSSPASSIANATCGSATSLDTNAGGPTSGRPPSQGKGMQAVSPSKQPRTLSSWKCTFKGSVVRAQPAKIGGSSVDVSSLPATSNWLMNGLSSLRSHRRTSSGERVGKDSPLSHRLSTYDNVTSSSLSVPSVASTPWSTSSCEISVSESVCSDQSRLSSSRAEWSEAGSDQAGVEGRAPEMTKSGDGMELCVRSTGCCENGNVEGRGHVAEDAEDKSYALSSLVTELKDELKKQKILYESQIRKLEETSASLHEQVDRLEEELDQEKKKYRMLEIKLHNSERAREDAERRNRLLQSEMEEFFSTLGDLSMGARTSKM